MITVSQLKQFATQVKADQYDSMVIAINAAMEKYDITTARRIRYFMTQSSFESQGLTRMVENLNYKTPQRLVDVWPPRFTLDHTNLRKAYAPDYINNPEKLGEYVYGGRNGNDTPGDGFLFRGRGPFGLTGRGNYAKCSAAVYGDDRLVANPDLVSAYADGFLSAGWFWDLHGFNAMADSDSFTQVTKIINGSEVTVPDRLVVLNKANLIF